MKLRLRKVEAFVQPHTASKIWGQDSYTDLLSLDLVNFLLYHTALFLIETGSHILSFREEEMFEMLIGKIFLVAVL